MEGPARLRPQSSMISAPKHFPRLQNKQASICTNSKASVRGLLPGPGSEGTASQTILSAALAASGTTTPFPPPRPQDLSFSSLMVGERSAPPGVPLAVHLEGIEKVCVCACVWGGQGLSPTLQAARETGTAVWERGRCHRLRAILRSENEGSRKLPS